MNYIRTKDGSIYDLKSKEISSIEQKDCWVNIFYYDREKGQYLEWDDNGGRSMDTIYKTEIIKESDTIEELCDEFVYVNKVGNFDKSYVIHYNMSNHIFTEPTIEEKIAYIKKYYKDELDKIRGAIYTDKGLIYVAKMDSEGKLVLI